MKELATALSQVKYGEIHKSKTVKVTTKSGGSYTFEYAPMEAIMGAIRGPLAEQGLVLHQSVEAKENGSQWVKTTLIHSSGESLQSMTPVIVREGMTAQEMGSSITYARRYGVTLACCLVADEDDDANIADGNDAEFKAAPGIQKNTDQEVAYEKLPVETIAGLRHEAKAIEGDFYTLGTKPAITRYESFKKTANQDEIDGLWSFLDSKVRNGMKRFKEAA